MKNIGKFKIMLKQIKEFFYAFGFRIFGGYILNCYSQIKDNTKRNQAYISGAFCGLGSDR